MNTLIHKLADQAHKESYVVYLQLQEAEGPANVIFYDIFNEKFAELIVRECANRLRETDYELMFTEDGMCDPSISDAMIVAASDIEEHFGVDNGE